MSNLSKLTACDPRLQRLFNKVAEGFEFTVICGHRSKDEQDLAFNTGKSKLAWPKSKHNSVPSKAVDAVPVEYKNDKMIIDWNDVRRICFFAGYVLATAKALNIPLRWGGDWDGDTELKDNSFNDLVHFELIGE